MEDDTQGQRWFTWALWKEGQNATEIQQRLANLCGPHAPHVTTVRRWIVLFKEGKNTTEDTPEPGPPATAVTEENIQSPVKDIVIDEPIISVVK